MTREEGESVFVEQGGQYVPTDHARGPWDPQALHGGAPAALITAAFENAEAGTERPISRLTFELLRPVPSVPLTIHTRTVRAGRRVAEMAAELRAGEQLIARASALCLLAVPELPAATPPTPPDPPMEGPEAGTELRFALDGSEGASFGASAMEMSWLRPPSPGPGRVWMRLRHPLVLGVPTSPLASLAAVADFGNGVSAALPFEDFLFINADLSIHLYRQPRGEWIGLDSRTHLHPGGSGLAESVLHDRDGPLGRAFQSLVVAPR